MECLGILTLDKKSLNIAQAEITAHSVLRDDDDRISLSLDDLVDPHLFVILTLIGSCV